MVYGGVATKIVPSKTNGVFVGGKISQYHTLFLSMGFLQYKSNDIMSWPHLGDINH